MTTRKKNRRTINSDWRIYFGSSKKLDQAVEKYGKENFKREIIRLCCSKVSGQYHEIYHQMMENALPSLKYFNDGINVRFGGFAIGKLRESIKQEEKIA